MQAQDEDDYDFLDTGITTLLESNLFTRDEDYTIYTQPAMVMTNFVLIMENENYQVYLNPDGLALRVVDVSTGFIWASDINDLDAYPLTGGWLRRIRSAITIDFLNESNIAITSSILQRRASENAMTSYQVNGLVTRFFVDFHIEQISMEYTVELLDDAIIIQVDRDSIEEYGASRLTSITLYEFFGSVHSDDVPGYFFIPSGNGALIRFTATSTINSVYRARFYSQDKYRSIIDGESNLNYPVYGSVHGVDQNALFSHIIEGAEFAEYIYKPPTYQTEFHSQNAIFLMRENHVQPISGGETLTVYEAEIKDYNPTIQHTFIEGPNANYIGFAKTLKRSMIESGMLQKSFAPDEVSMHMDVFMKDYEQGLIFKNPYVMTSVTDLLSIHHDLAEEGISSIQYTLRGYNRGGYSDRSMDNLKFDRSLGDMDNLDDLDIEFYYDPTVQYSYQSLPPKDTLQMVNKNYYVSSVNRGDYYRFMMDIGAIFNIYDTAYATLTKHGGIAIDGLSNELNSNESFSRTDVKNYYEELFSDRVSMYRPAYFNIGHTSQYYMSSLYHNRSRFFTDSVPFEQILLSGYLPVYSQFLNFTSNINVDLLKTIEFGILPSFLITAQPSYLLSDTMSSDFYATYYDNLRVYILRAYRESYDALNLVIGHEIIDREVLSTGVVRVDYDNGYSIYVNYTQDIFTSGSITIEPFDYLVSEVIV
jgi:hypothetical protein